MATPLHQAPTADIVANAFVHQYYLILHQSPQLVHRFYQDISKLGRPEENGAMSITTTMQAINDKILALHYGEFSAEITTVDAQESYNGGVIVLVTGYLTGKDSVRRKFSQSFFLAPQDKGYFVLNDVFRYVDDAYHFGSQATTNDVEAPITPDQDHSPVQENHVSDQTAISSEEVSGEEVDNPSENGDGTIEEEEAPVPEVVDAIPDDTHVAAESDSKVEEVPKKSYASIVKVMKDSALPVSSPPPASLRSIMKIQEQPPASATSPAPASEKQVTNSNATENGTNQEAEGPSIYLKGLPPSATHALLENEFRKFGTIRAGGIQVKTQKGFCFGFVEFEEENAVQSAIEASPIVISGHRVVVEPKKSTRGGNRGRFSSRAGNGYRNEGTRGRGNYGGGRGYGRGDFGNRSEFENRGGIRGGFSNRGGDGYQRNDNGGRVNRAGRLTVNVTAKNVAPRVSAPA
ncbi:nuclear transport factor 2 (NTF2) family protein [Citrus sinensis]|uniref:nuclear transport factor 2 isoform X1 n=1 Tax=Citrus sinensis TaxID=2711 RepID=UPI0021A0B745|nr:nuclear transport factor 2 isoform X1 [Citrus sinensis]KAH9728735.1 nuclear transport factor 2 (NTF2) family protein [Citrus sinensis]